MGDRKFATIVFIFFSFVFERVNCNADAIVITTTNGTATIPLGCNDSVVYCVFRPISTAQLLDTWEIDADQEGFCVNREAWRESGSLYSQSYVNSLSCPLSTEALALVQAATESNVLSSGCDVTVAESRPSSAQLLFQRPTAFNTISAESDEKTCEDITANRFNTEESCLTSLPAFFLNASLNIVKIEEIDCDAAQNAIGFRLRRHDESPKGTLRHPLCGGTVWEIVVTRTGPASNDISPTVSTPAKDCEVFYATSTTCNLTRGGLLKAEDGSTTRITITNAEQELGEFEVMLSPIQTSSFSGESFTVELLYDGEVIVQVDVQNANTGLLSNAYALYVPFVVVPSKGIYKIMNTFSVKTF